MLIILFIFIILSELSVYRFYTDDFSFNADY